MKSRKHFTPAELITVLTLAIGIFVAVTVPLMEGRTAEAKWSQANATASRIQRAVRGYAVKTSVTSAQTMVGKNLSDPTVQETLGFSVMDLEGTYFTASDYTIISIDERGSASIRIMGSKANAPSGGYLLETNGDWLRLR